MKTRPVGNAGKVRERPESKLLDILAVKVLEIVTDSCLKVQCRSDEDKTSADEKEVHVLYKNILHLDEIM